MKSSLRRPPVHPPSQFASVVNVTFPNYFRRFLAWVEVVEIDFTWVTMLGCDFQTNFYHRLLAVTLSPLALLGLLGLTLFISRYYHGRDELIMARIQRRHLAVLIHMTFLVYSTASSLILQTFSCDRCGDGNYYLRADYSISCYVSGSNKNKTHLAYMLYAGFMFLVYPVGIPALYAILLILRGRWRKKVGGRGFEGALSTFEEEIPVHENMERQRLIAQAWNTLAADLWAPYKHRHSYYEVVECLRRVMLTGVVVFILPGSATQVSTTFLIALFFFIVSESLKPYATAFDAWMYRIGHVVVLLSMFLAVLVKIKVEDENDIELGTLSVITVVANVFMALAVVAEAAMSMFQQF